METDLKAQSSFCAVLLHEALGHVIACIADMKYVQSVSEIFQIWETVMLLQINLTVLAIIVLGLFGHFLSFLKSKCPSFTRKNCAFSRDCSSDV